MNPKHILLPSDLSEASLRPLERAPELFAGRQVTLLAVVPSLAVPVPGAHFAPALDEPDLGGRLKAAREELEKLTAKFPATADVTVEAVGDTNTGEAIARWAEEHDVDLIALSTHGRTGLRRLALGSVAEAVLRRSAVPVLCFPHHGAEK